MQQLDYTTDGPLDRAEEEILIYTVSDDVLEAAAIMMAGVVSTAVTGACPGCGSVNPCC